MNLNFLIIIVSIQIFTNNAYARTPQESLHHEKIKEKIIKPKSSGQFISIDSYADPKINRPNLEVKKDFYTLPEPRKNNYYDSPDMNAWANQKYGPPSQEGGTFHMKNHSYTLSTNFSHDPFHTPLPGPK
jgi:hypothetical protein